MNSTNAIKTRGLVEVSLFAAIVVILAFTPFLGYIPLGFTRATIVHIPVILASILLGPKKGGIIGFVFGLTSLFKNTFEPTITSFAFSPFYSLGDVSGNFYSLIICFVPRILVGIIPFFVFNGINKVSKNDSLSLGIAGISGALTNTLLVMGSIYIFFGKEYAAASNIDIGELFGFIITTVVGINGIPEAIIGAVITVCVGKVLLNFNKKRAYN